MNSPEVHRGKKGVRWVCIFYFLFFIFSFAVAKEYDGIWFLGFNHNKKIFQSLKVRQAISYALDKSYIATQIMSEEAVPGSFIPPGMLGYDSSLLPPTHDLAYAKFLLKEEGYPINDSRLKKLSLLHTDGIKTVMVAKKIKNDLTKIGMRINLVEVPYKDQEKWENELSSGKYDLFLMGYKAGIEQLFTTQEVFSESDSLNLLDPLFKSKGPANFTHYHNLQVDLLLEQLANFDPSLRKEREVKFKEINKILYQDLPVVILFYIERI